MESQINTKSPVETLNIIPVNMELMQEFLKFQGRCYKQPLHTTLAFFAQNPNAEVIQ
ncbi:hypothetical protein FACS1894132_14850 [Clostridia bacterium]|nr:hypothetical protein FACS1894132_14850 [Clostridia bacterium]